MGVYRSGQLFNRLNNQIYRYAHAHAHTLLHIFLPLKVRDSHRPSRPEVKRLQLVANWQWGNQLIASSIQYAGTWQCVQSIQIIQLGVEHQWPIIGWNHPDHVRNWGGVGAGPDPAHDCQPWYVTTSSHSHYNISPLLALAPKSSHHACKRTHAPFNKYIVPWHTVQCTYKCM